MKRATSKNRRNAVVTPGVVPRAGFAATKAQAIVYLGPSVDGRDKEYVKVLSGDVDHRKPSFA